MRECGYVVCARVWLQVENLSFSGHADSKGIMQFMRQIQPQHVVLVHGECAVAAPPPPSAT